MAALRNSLACDFLCSSLLKRAINRPLKNTSVRSMRREGDRGRPRNGREVQYRPKFFTPLMTPSMTPGEKGGKVEGKPLDFNKNNDWSSVYQTAKPFDPYLIPLSIRMGRAPKGGVSPPAVGNDELLKIPNFFHLTPPAIKKHCEALKKLCTPWPSNLPFLPVKLSFTNYVSPSSDIRNDKSRIVHLKFKVSDLKLPRRSRDKMIKLADHRYNTKTDTITLKGDRCPTRKQNVEYVEYIMKVLYIESMKQEAWEKEDLE